MQNLTRWYQELECPVSYEQIDHDLSNFPDIDMDLVAPEAVSRFSDRGRHSLCHYKIVDNKVCHACTNTHTHAPLHTCPLTHTQCLQNYIDSVSVLVLDECLSTNLQYSQHVMIK